jgi:hypothetical protein
MKGKKKWILALIVLLSLAGGAGAYYAFRTDPKVAKVLDLGKQMEGLPREERGKLFGEMRAAMEDLTQEQRDQIRRQMFNRGDWRAREQKRMNEFFALSKKERMKSLDKEIDAMVKRQKDREKRRREAQQLAQANGQSGGQGGGGGGGNQQGGRGGGGTGDRGQDRRLGLDNSSASQQAQSSEYRRMMANRMAQRGIPFTGGGGGFGGFGGGGRGGR